MKIVHIIGYFQPEYGYEEYYTALNQAKMGHEVHVLTSNWIVPIPGLKRQERKRKMGIEHVDGIIVHRLFGFDIPRDMIFMPRAFSELKKIKPDVVHCHGANQPTNFLLPLLKKRLGFTLIYDHHEFFYDRHSYSYKGFNPLRWLFKLEYLMFRRYVNRWALSRSDHIIAVLDVCYEHLVNYHRVDPTKVTLIRLGVETLLFRRDEEAGRKIRNKCGFSPSDRIILFPGTFSRRKKIEHLLEVLVELKPRFKLLLVGDGQSDYMNELLLQIKQKDLSNRVFITGKVDIKDLYRFYSACNYSLFLNSSSVSILESMSCEVPPIISHKQQFAFIAQNGNGWVLHGENFSEWASEIKEIFHKNEEWKIRGKKSQRHMEESYSYRNYARQVLSVYNRFIAR